MNTLTLELTGKDRTYKGTDALKVLTALLAKGYNLSLTYILWDELDRPIRYVRYIQKGKGYQAEVIAQLTYLKEDEQASEVVLAIEIGFELAQRSKKPQIKVAEVA